MRKRGIDPVVESTATGNLAYAQAAAQTRATSH